MIIDKDPYYEEVKTKIETKSAQEGLRVTFTGLEGYAPVQGYGWYGAGERFYFRVSQSRASLEIGKVNEYLQYLDQLLTVDLIYPALELGLPLLTHVPTFEETTVDYASPELMPNIITQRSQFDLPLEQVTLAELFTVLHRNLKPVPLEPQKEVWKHKTQRLTEAFETKSSLGLTYFIPNELEESY